MAELVDDAKRLEAEADGAAGSGRVVEATRLLRRAAEADPRQPGLWIKIAALCRASGDYSAALSAISEALKIDPLDFVALLSRARLHESMGNRDEAARDYSRALAQKPADDEMPEHLRSIVAHAEAMRSAYTVSVSRIWDAAIDSDGELDPKLRSRLSRFKTNALRETRVFHSEPSHYHYPGLVECEFHDREQFPWLDALEAEAGAIRLEMLALLRERAAKAEPYVQYARDMPVRQWAGLNHSMDWTAFHLLQSGRRVPQNADRCPRTMAVLATIPQPHIAGRSPNAMFSLLKPHTRIPPHTGVANTRLVCHLPLLIPENCWFRVGAETRTWTEGEAFLFDDTIEHEAANDSDQPRAVMIFDVWHPGLSEPERSGVRRVMEAEEATHGAPI